MQKNSEDFLLITFALAMVGDAVIINEIGHFHLLKWIHVISSAQNGKT